MAIHSIITHFLSIHSSTTIVCVHPQYNHTHTHTFFRLSFVPSWVTRFFLDQRPQQSASCCRATSPSSTRGAAFAGSGAAPTAPRAVRCGWVGLVLDFRTCSHGIVPNFGCFWRAFLCLHGTPNKKHRQQTPPKNPPESWRTPRTPSPEKTGATCEAGPAARLSASEASGGAGPRRPWRAKRRAAARSGSWRSWRRSRTQSSRRRGELSSSLF